MTMTNMNTLLLLLISSVAPSVFSYAPSIATPPGVPTFVANKPTFGVLVVHKEEEHAVTTTKRKTTSQASSSSSYDLGLGKNKPVGSSRAPSNTSSPPTYDDAAKFWMAPEPVHNYPSPLLLRNADEQAATTPSIIIQDQQQKKKMLPKVVPHRMAQNEVDIIVSTDEKQATATLRVNAGDLEVNTLWVEMLIHQQQQQQFAPAAIGV